MVQRYGPGVRSSYRARITQKADNRAMQGKRILLGVTGGIAAYKSADLVRRLVEQGAEVQVVMTAAAREFVTPITFQALSGRAVRTDLWDVAAEAAMGHIELARWAQLVLVAPASADFLARLAHGLADDLLTTLCLATEAPIAVAPAMNQLMWRNAATRSNVELLSARGVRLIGPAVGDQACGEHGPGRLVEPIEIVAQIAPLLAPAGPLTGRRVLLTAGPTRECIDPVRFVSNRSSGKMGFAMAQAMRAAGAEVVLVSGPVSLPTPPGVRRIDVESAEQMHAAVQRELPGTAIFIGTAAVADYRPVACAPQKIKKNSETLALELTRTTDILSQVSASVPRPFMVGFAAETNAVEHYARAKLLAKNLDLIAANEVGHTKAFDCDENSLLVLWRGGRVELPVASKQELARALTGVIVEQFLAQQDGAKHDDAPLARLEDARAS
jgi:phosphopantothenoylcysteine decarboxylase/phosphopantothenate--cysteine ligase